MAVYALGDLVPRIDPEAFVHPDATVIGKVTIGPESTVWPSAVIRADYGFITIGARSSIQDGSVLHTTPEHPTTVEDDCVIGHLVHLEGCTVRSGALVGSGAIVLHGAVIEPGGWVGAGAVVPNGMVVPSGAMALGVPAKLRLDVVDPAQVLSSAGHYAKNGRRYRELLRRVGP
jgi:carbonic anhydrase/acetyltransferase-like protein (isoleucine patch superfamily)